MPVNKTISRNSNIELLRILSAIGIIILHYNNELFGGAFYYVAPHSINEFILYSFQYLSIASLNIFILISGYYLSKNNSRTILKPLKLVVQVVFISLFFYLLDRILFNSVSVVEFINKWCCVYWFVSIYIALYFISPYINLVFNKLTNKQTKVFIAILFIVFSVEPTLVDFLDSVSDSNLMFLSTISNIGSSDGYSIVNMCLVYSIGAIIRENIDCINKYNSKVYLLLFILCSCINSMLSFITPTSSSYCSPLVILEAVAVFCFFIRQKQFTSTVINLISRNAFSVYLSHIYLLRFLSIPVYVNAVAPIMILHMLISCIIIYLIGWIIGQVYSIITDPVFSILQKKINFYKYDTGD